VSWFVEVVQSCSEQWAGDDWRAEAVEWIASVTRAHGLTITGECAQPRIRFWSTQLTVPTDAGLLWFKENCPGQDFEARLVSVLAELVPDQVLAPLAVEETRGWMLTPDGGPTLANGHAADLDVWRRVVGEWAELQRRLAGHTERLLAVGVTAMPPAAAARYVAERIDVYAARPAGDAGHIDAETTDRLRALLPDVRRWAEQLDATGLPSTLDHNDLHANNAFVPRHGERRLRFFDFGDAVLSHPLCSLMIPLRVLADTLKTDSSDPRLRTVVDAYLEPWTDLADLDTLRAAVEPATRLAMLNRGESWRRVLPYANAEELKEWGVAATWWLTGLLQGA